MTELIFEVTQEQDGGFVAEPLGENIVTEAHTWQQLRLNVQEEPSRMGTLATILAQVAQHKNVTREDILRDL